MSLKKNILFNYLGVFWGAISGYFFLPLYLKFLDKETFGLVMFTITIQSLIQLLDAGFSSAIKRKLAWRGDDHFNNLESLSFLRGVERFYLLILLCTVSITWILTYIVKIEWFDFKLISRSEVNLCMNMIIISASLQLFISIYGGGMQALEKQVSANVYQFFLSLFRNGIVVILIYFFPEPILFFSWQLLVVLVFVFIYRTNLLKELMPNKEGVTSFVRIKKNEMVLIFKSSLPFFLISIFSTINLQVDKILVTELLPISEFGVYGMVFNLAQLSVIICGPIASAVAPRFVNLYSKGKIEEISKMFRIFTKITTIISITLGCVLFFYFEEILYLWTGNNEIASKSTSFSFYMILAGVFLAGQVIPYNLALASMSLIPVIYACSVNIILTIPLYYLMIQQYGLEGAGIVWVLSNIFMFLANVFFYMRTTIPGKYVSWLFIDFVGVGLISIIVFMSLYTLFFDFLHLDFSPSLIFLLTGTSLIISFLIIFNRNAGSIVKLF
jgi:O-antigen/teichoic acid export membrane protein